MPNLLQRGATWLGGKLQTAGGRSVTYRRGQSAVVITATPQMHKRPVIGEDGIATEEEIYSWTITASELALNGEVVEPKQLDTITETLNGVEVKWKVLPLDERTPCFQWLDSSGLLLLVHTKRVE